MESNQTCFRRGVRDGMPIALGYFAVAFTLGIAAKNAGFTAVQAMVESLTNNASAGEYAVFSLVGAGAGYWEVAVMTLVANARYLLMSCALSQKLAPDTPLYHRMLVAYDVTDEVFGISIAYPGRLNPWYTYGAIAVAIPGWGLGTFFGVVVGNVLPLRLVSALSVGLYACFWRSSSRLPGRTGSCWAWCSSAVRPVSWQAAGRSWQRSPLGSKPSC